MALASVMAEHEAPLRADLQQYFGIDLDRAMDGEHSVEHVTALVSQLPQEARLVCMANPDARWTIGDVLLASLVNSFNRFVWGMSDKRKRGPKPKLVGPSFMTEKDRQTLPARVMSIDKLIQELSKPRRRDDGAGSR